MQEGREVRRPSRRLSRRGIIALFCLVALAAAAVVLGFTMLSGSPATEAVLLPFSSSSEYGFTDRGIMAITGETLLLCSTRGEERWEIPLSNAGCSLATGPTYGVIYTDSIVQAIDTDGNALFPSLEFSGTVLNVQCGASTFGVYKSESDGSTYIYLYDLAGNRLDRLSLNNPLLNFGFYGSADTLWTLMINTDSSLPVCTISTYNVATHADTGAMTKEGQIIERVYFGGSSIYAAGTNHLIVYTAAGQESSSTLIYGWKVLDCSLSGSSAQFLLSLRQESSSSASTAAKVLNLSTGSESTFRLPAGTLGAFFSGSRILVAQAGRISYYSASGDLQSVRPLEFTADAARKENGYILLASGESLYLIP